jgi:predicted flap endonuclease-1-like 5' DNA nuclease
MVEIASLIVVNLLIATLIGFVIGYFVGKGSNSLKSIDSDKSNDNSVKSESKAKSGINPIFKKNSGIDTKPLVLSSSRPTGKDNLKKIKGIDSKVETDLNNLGIYHFDQIAKWSNKNCDWIDEFLLLPGYSKKFQWVDQAKILASGKETLYSQKVENNEVDVI